MINPISELILSITDHGLSSEISLLPVGTIVEDFTLTLSSKRQLPLEQVLANGPLVLVFIRGTWCPFCRLHLSRLRTWVEKLKNKHATVVVVSTESVDNIQKWLKDNPVSYIFASDVNFELSNYFGVHINANDFANAATFVIDTNRKLKLAYKGKRTKANFSEVDNSLV